MSKPIPVGIDLGTTYSAMAWMDGSRQSRLVPNAEGDLLTPSVVLFEDDRVVVGREAKRLGLHDAERMVECAKREMGNPLYSRPICGRKLPPEVIQSFVLRKMKQDLIEAVGPEFRVVITVPAFFDEPRRKATFDAAQMAGLQVLDIVNEPTAAALAYGEELGFLKQSGASKEKMYVLVYDLGGGTFDATLIEMQAGNLRTIATDGDYKLGGRDFDQALADYAAAEFMLQHQRDPKEDHSAHARLVLAAEEAKHTLTARQNASIKINYAGQTLDVKVTRELFEEESAHLLERTAYVTRQLLTAAGLSWEELSRILLVGGSTRMPMVAQMLKDRTGITPEHGINPDEAVARGAALFADYVLSERVGGRKSFAITNVNSHSLGIEGIDQSTGRRRNNIIIPRNTALPARKTERFVTKNANQRSVVVKVLEGESSEPTECTPIGKTAIRNLPSMPGGCKILVTYEYGTNGRLSVTAKVEGTETESTLQLEREGALSFAMVTQWARLVESGCGIRDFDRFLASHPDGAPAPQPARAPAARPAPAPAPQPVAAAPAPQAAPVAAQPAAATPAVPAATPQAAAPVPQAPVPQAPVAQAPQPASGQPVATKKVLGVNLSRKMMIIIGVAVLGGMLLMAIVIWLLSSLL